MTRITRRTAITAIAAAPLAIASVTTAQAATTHAVAIKGFAFSPDSLTIKAGDSVTFTNEDGAPHTATAKDKSWDTGRLSRGKSKTITFAKAGNFDYFCRVHPNMTAKLIVK